jgi:siroheme decarboxylase
MTDTVLPDRIDLCILDALQENIPLAARPYAALASRIGITEAEFLARLERLHDTGIVRGISPVLESRHLGLSAATLVAMHVPEDRLQTVAAIVSSYPEVSHNFRREHHYSLWFTIAARNELRINAVLAEILGRTGISAAETLDLPTVRKLKINVRFSFAPLPEEDGSGSP